MRGRSLLSGGIALPLAIAMRSALGLGAANQVCERPWEVEADPVWLVDAKAKNSRGRPRRAAYTGSVRGVPAGVLPRSKRSSGGPTRAEMQEIEV